MNKDQYNYDIGVQISNRSDGIKVLEEKLNRLRKLRVDIYARGQEDKVRNRRQNTLIEYREKVSDCDKKIQQTEDLSDTLKRRNGLLDPLEKETPRGLRSRSKSKGKSPTTPRRSKTPSKSTPPHLRTSLSSVPFASQTNTTQTNTTQTEIDFDDILADIKKLEMYVDNIGPPGTQTGEISPSFGTSDLKKIKKKLQRSGTPKYPVSMAEMADVLQTLVEQGDLSNVRTDIREWIIRFYSDEIRNIEKMNDTLAELAKEIDSTQEKLAKEKSRDCCF